MKKNFLFIFKKKIVPPVWVKDSAQTTCSGCNESFNAFKRRHHCRTCGQLFCHSCCSEFIPVQFNEYRKSVRVCNNCFSPLKQQYERQLSSSTLVSPPVSPGPNVINQVLNTVRSLSNKNLNDNETKEQEEKKIDLIDLNELFRPIYEKPSRKAIRYSSSSRSNKTDSFHENDSFSSFTDEELIKPVKESELIIDKPFIESNLKPPLPPKPRTVSTNLKIFNRREAICQEYGFLKKVQINKEIETETGIESNQWKMLKWERVLFVFYSDRTLGICSSPDESFEPRLVIPLNHYCLKNLDENSFGLERIQLDVTNESDANSILGLNGKRNIFELNYEIMFRNKDLK